MIDPRIYYSAIRLDFLLSAFLYQTFTVLYSHNQHAIVTSVKIFVNVRCFKSEDRTPQFDKNNTVSRSAIIFQTEIHITCDAYFANFLESLMKKNYNHNERL